MYGRNYGQTSKKNTGSYFRRIYGIAFKKGNSTLKLKENIDSAIRDMQQKNVLPRLRKKWEIGV